MRKFAEYVLVFYMLVLSWPGDIYVSALAVKNDYKSRDCSVYRRITTTTNYSTFY